MRVKDYDFFFFFKYSDGFMAFKSANYCIFLVCKLIILHISGDSLDSITAGMHACMYVYMYMYVCTYVRTCVCMYICTCMYVHTYVCMYVRMYMCMYVCT